MLRVIAISQHLTLTFWLLAAMYNIIGYHSSLVIPLHGVCATFSHNTNKMQFNAVPCVMLFNSHCSDITTALFVLCKILVLHLHNCK